MKYQKILVFMTPILLFLLVIFSYIKLINVESDSIKFKNEYEKLNDKNYFIEIDEDNPIKYSTYNEIFNSLKNGTSIIYLGYPEDNNSRFTINTLLKVINDNKINTIIYYLDIHKDRDSYIIDNDKLIYEKDGNNNELKGTLEYFKLMELLDSYIGEYIILFEDKEYDVLEKRIPIPSIIFIKNGNILGLEYTSVDMDSNEVYSTFENYLLDMYSSLCDTENKEPC